SRARRARERHPRGAGGLRAHQEARAPRPRFREVPDHPDADGVRDRRRALRGHRRREERAADARGGCAVNAIQIDMIKELSLSDAEILAAMPAFKAQIEEDFKPVWGFGADLHFVPKGARVAPAKGHWWMGVFDRSDQAGALGYHNMTSDGLPFGKVFYL